MRGVKSVRQILFGLLASSALLALVWSIGWSSASSAADFTSYQARSAASFVDSIGVNTHLGQTDRYAYHNAFNSVIKPKLQELGVRHVRDSFPHAGVDFNQQLVDLGALSNPIGSSPPIQFDLIAGPDPAGTSNPRNGCYLPSLIVMMQGGTFNCGDVHPLSIAAANAIKVKAAENTNEPDHCPSYIPKCGGASTPSTWWPKSLINNPTWPSDVLGDAQTLQSKLHSSSVTSGISILAPAFVWLPYFGDVTYPSAGSTLTDYLQPLRSYIDRSATHLGCLTSIKTCYAEKITPYTNFFGGQQMVVSEAGYSTSEYTEKYQAKYLTSMFFDFFARGVERTYVYEFWDNPEAPTVKEQTFGIIHKDGSPKPAYTWLKNALTLLKDSGGSPATLELKLSLPSSVSYLLLQKSDKTFWLALQYDKNSRTDTDSTVAGSIEFRAPKNLNYFNLESTDPFLTESGKSTINLNIPDRIVMIQISDPAPPGSTPGSGGGSSGSGSGGTGSGGSGTGSSSGNTAGNRGSKQGSSGGGTTNGQGSTPSEETTFSLGPIQLSTDVGTLDKALNATILVASVLLIIFIIVTLGVVRMRLVRRAREYEDVEI